MRQISPQALAGIKVVEFAIFAAGPVVAKHLGEHGATVIHVESRSRPDGFRTHYPPFKDNKPGLNRAGSFDIFNNDCLSIALNLKLPQGLEVGKRLVAWADVVIENFAPGVMARLGLDYETVRRINPQAIMLSSCNLGQTGPRARHRGFGSQLTSYAGFTHLTGYPDGVPLLPYGPYIDFIAVGYGLIAVLAALDFRRRTGQGQYIDLSQLECGMQFMAPAILEYQLTGIVPGRNGNRSPRAAPHGAYPCQGEDRWCVIAVFTQEEWQAFCQATGHPEWAHDPRFAALADRKANEDELDALVASWTRQFTPEEVMHRLQAVGVRAGIVQRLSDLFADPQLQHRGQWPELDHAELGRHAYEAPPFILSKTPAVLRRPSPLLGEHNRYVCQEILGMTAEEVAELERIGALE